MAVVTASDDHTEWAKCVELGASGVVPKTLPLADVVAIVGRLAAGEPLMTPLELHLLLREGTTSPVVTASWRPASASSPPMSPGYWVT